MFIEVHIPDRILLNVAQIYSVTEMEDGRALLSYGLDEYTNRIILCEETYDEVFELMGREEG